MRPGTHVLQWAVRWLTSNCALYKVKMALGSDVIRDFSANGFSFGEIMTK